MAIKNKKAMEAKKNPNKDIHRYGGTFFLIGLCISIGIMICAFEWTSEVKVYPDPSPVVTESFQVVLDPIRTEIKTPEIKKIIAKKLPIITLTTLPDQGNLEPSETEMSDTLVTTIENPGLEPPSEDTLTYFTPVERMPEPVGGYAAFYKRLAQEIKYPASARNAGIEGKVFVQFIVDQKGFLQDLKVIKGVNRSCDQEAMRVVSPTRWEPGKQRGKPVRVRMVLPVSFKMN